MPLVSVSCRIQSRSRCSSGLSGAGDTAPFCLVTRSGDNPVVVAGPGTAVAACTPAAVGDTPAADTAADPEAAAGIAAAGIGRAVADIPGKPGIPVAVWP